MKTPFIKGDVPRLLETSRVRLRPLGLRDVVQDFVRAPPAASRLRPQQLHPGGRQRSAVEALLLSSASACVSSAHARLQECVMISRKDIWARAALL